VENSAEQLVPLRRQQVILRIVAHFEKTPAQYRPIVLVCMALEMSSEIASRIDW
jgi:hypothetical protein